MSTRITLDGNEAAANIAYLASEVVAIYPITPASPMGELSDQWAASGKKNIFSTVPRVVEMQSEGGAAGAVHGALQTGALTTTFTASQGLLLMLPNLYKIAGELTPSVIHVAARSLATHALSIFCDHSDVMSARGTGYGILFSNSVQEAQDLALVAHMATLRARLPLLHVFDGFRTSHEINTIEPLGEDDVRALIDADEVRAHRSRALRPDRPVLRGTAQNPDVFFQAREASNTFYDAAPTFVQEAMDRLAERTGRHYHLFDYLGVPDAEEVIILMASAAGAAEEALRRLEGEGAKVGLLLVRLYRPFDVAAFAAALPKTVRSIAVLDRVKEPGAVGEPLYLDVLAALNQVWATGEAPFDAMPRVVGGRYGLSSKEFSPPMARALYQALGAGTLKQHFTVGIVDDVTHRSIDYDPDDRAEDPDVIGAVFYGLGSDGTVGANKNTVKIIGSETDHYAQAYFVYDSKKSGSVTVSHLRFGPRPIHSTYLISNASFVACHQFQLALKLDVLERARPGATFLLNSPYGPEEVWSRLPGRLRSEIENLGLKFYVIDAASIAREASMGRRINTIMQTCFFALSGVMPAEQAIEKIKAAIAKSYGKRGQAVVDKNVAMVDATLAHLHQVQIPLAESGEAACTASEMSDQLGLEELELAEDRVSRPWAQSGAPSFVRDVLGPMLDAKGDRLPVSAMPADGTFPTGTTRFEKRAIAHEIPVWDEDLCIQCGKCVLVCPHATIRAKVPHEEAVANAPLTFKTAKPRFKGMDDQRYTLQVAPDDCTGCGLCVEVCPVKDKRQVRRKALNMAELAPVHAEERRNWDYFLTLPEVEREQVNLSAVKEVQLLQPLFEFSSACSGCGETPYLKLLSQLFGDRLLIANATGCSSIYGGNLPTTPWAKNAAGRGPAWSNSLFEDNAEFGLGMRLSVDKQSEYARELLEEMEPELGEARVRGLMEADQSSDEGIEAQRERVLELRRELEQVSDPRAVDLLALADKLVDTSVWIVGGDGWAYDIGFGGLDHVFASGEDVNILVLDTEVYSNTGGQMSKATPRAAVAKYASSGKPTAKKDLGQIAMSYGNVYVAQIAMGAHDKQTLKAFREAEAYKGPSLLIAYSHCIAHGYDMRFGMAQQHRATRSGYWPLYRSDPRRAAKGEPAMQLDSKAASIGFEEFAYNETRYSMLARSQPERARNLLREAKNDIDEKWKRYEELASAAPKPGTSGKKEES